MEWCKQKWVNLKAHSIHGRLNRLRYFTWNLGYGFLLCIPALVITALAFGVNFGFLWLMIPLVVLQMIIWVLIFVGRLHDLNLSGWYAAVFYAISYCGPLFGETMEIICAVISLLVSLILLFKRGTIGPNRFGNDPVDEE